MSFIFRLFALILKCAFLFFIISFERVIGLPVFFLTLTISFLLLSRSLSKYVIFIIAAFLLAIFYQISFVLSFVILVLFYLGFIFGVKFNDSNLQRFILLLILSSLLIGLVVNIDLSVWIVLQFVLGIIVSGIFLLKYLFVKYGFIGKRFVRS